MRFVFPSIKSPTKTSFYTLKVILQDYIHYFSTGFKVLHKQDSKLITLLHSFLNFFKLKISAEGATSDFIRITIAVTRERSK